MTSGVWMDGEVFIDKYSLVATESVELKLCGGMVVQRLNLSTQSMLNHLAYGLRPHGVWDRAGSAESVERSRRGGVLWKEMVDEWGKSGLALSGGRQQPLCIAPMMTGVSTGST